MGKSDEEILQMINETLDIVMSEIHYIAKEEGKTFTNVILRSLHRGEDIIRDLLLKELQNKNILIDDHFKRILSKMNINLHLDYVGCINVYVHFMDLSQSVYKYETIYTRALSGMTDEEDEEMIGRIYGKIKELVDENKYS